MVNCLVIDMNALERQKLATWLSGMGHACREFDVESDAMNACNDNAPDVVVMSAQAQVEDVLKQFSDKQHYPVVLIYSEMADVDQVSQNILCGASDVLMKPFDRDMLRFKLQQNGIASA